jgi:hypothetical protein
VTRNVLPPDERKRLLAAHLRKPATPAKGSESGWSGFRGMRVCAGCGERVTVTRTRGGLWFERDERVWHMECGLRHHKTIGGHDAVD